MTIPARSIFYQWESLLYRENLSRKDSYDKQFGYKVLSRNEDSTAKDIEFSIYANDNRKNIYLVGPFNDWGKTNRENYLFAKVGESGFQKLTTTIQHKEQYLFLIVQDGHEFILRDPSATYFDNDGNCIFWDFEDPTAYKKMYEQPDTLHRTTKLLQTDLPGLVSRWYLYKEDQKNLDETDQDLFTYIRTSGVLEKIKELGFNTIQFLPVTQSIDGDNWKFRYLVPYAFAIQKNWGDPDSFAAMIDHCHKLGIAVIIDLILSHCPHTDFKLFGVDGKEVGIHRWSSKHNEETYLQEFTPWGTMRFRYGDGNIRRYLTESALHLATTYGVDGFRIDNVDGILRYGDAGDGDERPFGREFLRELIAQVYHHNPLALIHLESHYFYGDNAKMLVAPLSATPRAIGATAYNSSRLTYYFHKELMPKAAEEISTWRFEQIKEEKEWGRSNSTIADFHNHDAAAGLMHGRATGSYAYDALILKNPNLWFHAIGKIKIMEAMIAFGCEGRILDLLQSFLLQEGTFEHDSSIHWELLKNNPNSKKVVNYKKEIHHILEQPAFWPENTINREYVNIDEQNKTLVIKRIDKTQGTNKTYYILINLSSKELYNYEIGVKESGDYKVVFNGDKEEFAGTNNSLPQTYKAHPTSSFEHYAKAISIEKVSPYQVLVIEK